MHIVEQFVFDKAVCIVHGVLFPLGKKIYVNSKLYFPGIYQYIFVT